MVGAGLAGLAAARELTAAGHEVVVLEKSRGLGGRLASRRLGDTVLDHGSPATSAPEGSALRAAIAALPSPDMTETEAGVVYATGATRLPKLLAEGLDVRLGVRLAALRAHSDGLELGDEQGNTHGVVDAVVVTAPAPQAADLLERSPEPDDRVAALRALVYAPAVMVLAGLPEGLASWTSHDPGPGVLADVRRETVKGRAPVAGAEAFVARLGDDAARELLDASDEAVLDRALPALAIAVGTVGADPAWVQVKRWRYAVPIGHLDADAVNPAGSRIVIAGDTVTGASFGSSDHHRVFASGVAAARRIVSDALPVGS